MFQFDQQYVLYDVTPVENQFILNYLPSATGEQVKVYLYGLMQCRHPSADMSVERMARDLNMTEEEVLRAFRHWAFHGLVQKVDDKPTYRFVSAAARSFSGEMEITDSAYLAFGEALNDCFGEDRRLHGSETTMAFEWVENLGLPQEVVLAMVRHLISTKGRRFTFGTTGQKTAARLAEAQVRTVEEALDVLSADKKVEDCAKALIRRLRLTDGKRLRQPTVDEMNLCRKWLLDWGYEPAAIEEACSLTVNAGAPSFGYVDGILRRQREQGEAALTQEEMQQRIARDRQERDPVKELLYTLGISQNVTDGLRAWYAELTARFPGEMALRAARELSFVPGADLMDVQQELEKWEAQGLSTAGEVEEYLRSARSAEELVRKLYRKFGKRARPGTADLALAEKWLGEWGFDSEAVLMAAGFALEKEMPMAYLNKTLESARGQGLKSAQEIALAHQKHVEAGKGRLAAGQKQTVQQQYHQRTYSTQTPAEMPDWLRQSLEEAASNEQK